jgi:hypothetical protein
MAGSGPTIELVIETFGSNETACNAVVEAIKAALNLYITAASNYRHMVINSDSTSAINYPDKPIRRGPRASMYETDPKDGRTNGSAGGAGTSCNISGIHSCISRCVSKSGAYQVDHQFMTSK